MERGRVLTHPALARRRFVEIAERPDPLLDIVEGSLVIALEENPAVDIARHLDNVAAWSECVRGRLEGSREIERIVETINAVLFDEEGFHGEDEDYFDPRSALLSEALERHAGLPAGHRAFRAVSGAYALRGRPFPCPGADRLPAGLARPELRIEPAPSP